jgi:hypothetical protein
MYHSFQLLAFAAKRQLNDLTNGAERFSTSSLVQYGYDGQLEVFKLLPHLRVGKFTRTIGPQGFNEQRIPENCDFLLDVAYSQGASGREIPLQRGDYRLFRSYVGVSTDSPSFSGLNNHFTGPRRWYYDPSNPEVFYIEPNVGGQFNIVMTCTQKPSSISNISELHPIMVTRSNIILDYILMRAYEVDTESATSMERQKIHRNQFYQAIKMEYDASASINSKYYLGRKGDQGGDPRAA